MSLKCIAGLSVKQCHYPFWGRKMPEGIKDQSWWDRTQFKTLKGIKMLENTMGFDSELIASEWKTCSVEVCVFFFGSFAGYSSALKSLTLKLSLSDQEEGQYVEVNILKPEILRKTNLHAKTYFINILDMLKNNYLGICKCSSLCMPPYQTFPNSRPQNPSTGELDVVEKSLRMWNVRSGLSFLMAILEIIKYIVWNKWYYNLQDPWVTWQKRVA